MDNNATLMQWIEDKLRNEIQTAAGRKGLEFGSTRCRMAERIRDDFEYLALSDPSEEALSTLREAAAETDIHLIPYGEIGEDCYFGRFHMVYTLFTFHDLPHLVDEVMALRRLILKGGKMVIIDDDAEDFHAVCVKQLTRCGFIIREDERKEIDGRPVFFISAEK